MDDLSSKSSFTYEDLLQDQIASTTARLGQGDLDKLLDAGDTWTVD